LQVWGSGEAAEANPEAGGGKDSPSAVGEEEIRRRRLAFYENQSKKESATDGDAASSDAAEEADGGAVEEGRDDSDGGEEVQAGEADSALSPDPPETSKAEASKAEATAPAAPPALASPPKAEPAAKTPPRSKKAAAAAKTPPPELHVVPGQKEHNMISGVFEVLLDTVGQKTATKGFEVLDGLREEYDNEVLYESEEVGAPLFFAVADLDRIIMARLLLPKRVGLQQPLHYLMACFQRASQRKSRLQQGGGDTEAEALQSCQTALASYAGITLAMPETFAEWQGSLGARALVNVLLGSGDRVVVPDFFIAAVFNALDPSEVRTLSQRLLTELTNNYFNAQLQRQGSQEQASLMGGGLQHAHAIQCLVSSEVLAAEIVQSERWKVPVAFSQGQLAETRTALGMLLTIGPLDDEVVSAYFTGIHYKSKEELESSKGSLQENIVAFQTRLPGIFLSLLRGKSTKDAAVTWLATALTTNKKRNSEGYVQRGAMDLLDDPMVRSQFPYTSDTFMVNLTYTLIRLCDPFVNIDNGKYLKIDPAFAASSTLVQFEDESRLLASTAEAAEARNAAQASGDSRHNFITECFFLTAYAFHVGYRPACNVLSHPRYVGEWNKAVTEFNAVIEGKREGQNDFQADQKIAKFEKFYGRHTSRALQLNHPEMLTRTLGYVDTACAFLLNVAGWDGEDRGLVGTPPPQWGLLPQFILEELGTLVANAAEQHGPASVIEYHPRLNHLVGSLTMLLASRSHVPQVHIRLALLEAIFQVCPVKEEEQEEAASFARAAKVTEVFYKDPVVLKLLVPGLTQLYVDMQSNWEEEGGQRIRCRKKIAALFTYLSMSPEHVKTLRHLAADGREEALVEGGELSEAHGQTFFRFLLMLTSDMNSYFDTAVDKLAKIKQDLAWHENPSFTYLQDPMVLNAEAGDLICYAQVMSALLGQEREGVQFWGGGGDQEMTAAVSQLERARDGDMQAQEKVIAAKKVAFEENERTATDGNESTSQDLKILVKLAEAVPGAFVTTNVRDRVAMSINSMLVALVGQKATEIKLPDPAKYKFDPTALLQQLVGVYISLHEGNADSGSFAEAVARDGRSFKLEVFNRAIALLQRRQMVDEASIASFADFVATAAAKGEAIQEDEALLGEVPEEFIDEWTGELMTDPVTLPASRIVLERSSIERHLTTNEATDPYDRSPLTVGQLVPNTELRARIEAFLAERRHGR